MVISVYKLRFRVTKGQTHLRIRFRIFVFSLKSPEEALHSLQLQTSCKVYVVKIRNLGEISSWIIVK